MTSMSGFDQYRSPPDGDSDNSDAEDIDQRSEMSLNDIIAEETHNIEGPKKKPIKACSSDEYDTDMEEVVMETKKDEKAPEIDKEPTRRKSSSGHDGGGDNFGAVEYLSACEELQITPAQRVLSGLAGLELQLKYRSLGPAGGKALAEGLMHNTKVEVLNLEENGLEGEGGVYISQMLRENNFITQLNLAKNSLGSVGAYAIGEMLKYNNGITHLNLSENHFKDSDAELLATGIEKNERVICLDLSHNSFCEDGAVQLGRAIGGNNSIEHLDLSWNQVRRKGAVTICNGLKRNYCITTVNLSWNGFGYEGSLAVGEMLRGNKYLRELDISNNRINWEGALLISKGLKENDTLETFEIGWNPLTMTGCLDLLEAVDNPLSVLSYLGFTGIPVNRKIMYMMEGVQKQRNFRLAHGGLLESEDIFGRRMVLRCDPLKLLIQYLSDKGIRPVDLFRTFDKDNQHRVSREQFIQGLKKAQVPLDSYEMERVLNRLDSAKEGKISYQRLMRGVKEQIKVNREEERKRQLEAMKANAHHQTIKSEAEPVQEEEEKPKDKVYRQPEEEESEGKDSDAEKSHVNLSSIGQKSFIALAQAAGLQQERPISASSVKSFNTSHTYIPKSLRNMDPAAIQSHISMMSKGSQSSVFSNKATRSKVNMSAPLGPEELVVNADNVGKTPKSSKSSSRPPSGKEKAKGKSGTKETTKKKGTKKSKKK